MKYKILTTLALCIGTLGITTTSLADDVDPNKSQAESTGKVDLISNDDPWIPEQPPEIVNPTDPGTPDNPNIVKPDGGEGNPGQGTKAFHITWVSDLDFGKNKLEGKTLSLDVQGVKYYENGIISNENIMPTAPFIQLVDNSGQGGWDLTVKDEGFKAVSPNGTKSDTGMQITLKTKGSTQTIADALKPKLDKLESGINITNESTLISQTLAEKDANEIAAGTYSINFEGTKLTVPANIKTGSYEDTLTWILTKNVTGNNQ